MPWTHRNRGRDEKRGQAAVGLSPSSHHLMALSPPTHRLSLAARITQNPSFARMSLKGRNELSIRSLPNSLLHPPRTRVLTFTPCSPGGPFTPAGQLVGHWKENPIGPQGHLPGSGQLGSASPFCQLFKQSSQLTWQNLYHCPSSLPTDPITTTPPSASSQTPLLTRKSALPSRPWIVPGRP